MMEQGMPTIEQMEAWVRGAVDRHGDDGDRFAFSGILEDRDRLRSQLASLIDLIRKRYPRFLEPGNPLYDGVLARAVDAQAAAQAGGVVVPVPMEELAALREIVRLLDEARQRYDKHPRGAGGQRMPDEIDDLLCRLYEVGVHPADTRPKPRARALPASRVLGDGEVAVDEEELVALRCLDDAVTINGDGMSTDALGVDWEVARSAKRRLSDIRAAKGGAT